MEQISEYLFTTEEQAVIARSKAEGSYMRAPNGQATNLNEKQWAQVRTRAFKDWFGDWENNPDEASKVIDSNGEPKVVYHGTTNDDVERVWNERAHTYDTTHKPFSTFKRTNDGLRNSGHFFSSDQQNAYDYGYNIYDTFLNLRHPLVIDAKDAFYTSIKYNGKEKDTYDWSKYAENAGYDGVIFKNVRDGVDNGALQTPVIGYVAFKSNQIKSAIHNTGSFLESQDDIRFRIVNNDFLSFATKYDLEETDVKQYADSIRMRNLGGASYAFQNMKRKVRIDNMHDTFQEFSKRFSPIRKELYETFGNIDELREEVISNTKAEQNIMEAARKRAEKEAEVENMRLQEFRDMSDRQLDDEYFGAIDKNDETRIRDLVNEAARRKGYEDIDSDYQGAGAWAAPSNPGYESDRARRADFETNSPDINIEDIAKGYSPQPDDYFENLRAYGMNTPEGRESTAAINGAINTIRTNGGIPKIKVFRAVPTDVKENNIRNADWVTPSKKYAQMHGENRLEGNYRLIEQEIRANDLWWDGNNINEWGFDDGKEYRYTNTHNNRKLNSLITYNDHGNIIPLSQRFSSDKDDTRYRFMGEKGVSIPAPAGSARGFLSGDERMAELSRHASSLAGKQHIPVSIIHSIGEVDSPRVRDLISSGKDIRGWYDIPSDRICLYLPKARGKEDIERTLLHEGVGHYGLRKLAGRKHMDAFLDDIFAGCGEKIRGEIVRLAGTGKMDIRTATEEYLACMAESGTDARVWDKIRLAFRNLLRKLGFSIEVDDRELKGLLTASRENLKKTAVTRIPGKIQTLKGELEFTPGYATASLKDKGGVRDATPLLERMKKTGIEPASLSRSEWKSLFSGKGMALPDGKVLMAVKEPAGYGLKITGGAVRNMKAAEMEI